jgi:membrane-associated phospholipid phosphatase
MYNDRHWLTVAAGAGIGILCTKTAYWLYQKCKKLPKETKRQL